MKKKYRINFPFPFKQENLIENFILLSHNGTLEDIKIQIIGHCDPNNQEAKEDLDFLSGHFTSTVKGLNQKHALKY